MSAAAGSKHIDLSALSIPELRELRSQIDTHLAGRLESEKADLLAEFEQRAKERGFALADLIPSTTSAPAPETAPKAALGAAPPKYRHPTEPLQTWSGRGRQPKWVREHLAAGGTLEQLAISPTA